MFIEVTNLKWIPLGGVYHAPLKIALLLHKMANGPYSFSETVSKNFMIIFLALILLYSSNFGKYST